MKKVTPFLALTLLETAFRIILLCLICEVAAARIHAAAKPPNIVFIFVDDQGYYDLGCYGAAEIKTPRIDAMAKAGTRLTDYYAAAPICSPSRAGLLTGCYPRRVGNAIWVHRADSRSGIHPDELTIAELLKDNGYATACIGKWHLGFHEPFLPRNQGFNHYFGLLHNLDPVEAVYFEDKGGVPLMRNGDVVKRPADPAELTKLYTDEAIRFIEKNKEGPFFLYLPHTMLHNPLGVSEEFRGSSNWGEYGDAIQELDHNVGRIFDALKRMSIDDNTIVIYASDNGRGPGRTPEQKIRGRKLSTYEGGIRVPAIAWGPGLRLQAGAESSAVVRAMDWYPTLATFAGIKIPEGRVIDGRDISPLLKGETRIVPPPGMKKSLNASVPLRRRWNPPGEWAPLIDRTEYNDAFFYHGSHGALAAVRWCNWKLYLNPTLALYDLAKDPGESKPVRDRDITRKLRGMAILFQEEMRLDARPAGDAPPQPRADGRTEVSHATLESPDAKPTNVLFITIDDLRPELTSYKADGILTPHIDRLAAKGLQFNAAYCQYPVCNPSRSSLLTGLRPDELGVLSNKVALRKKWPDLVTLPQLFRNNGYFTAGLGKLFHLGTDADGRKILFRDDASFDYFFKAKGKEPEIGSKGEGRKLGDGAVKWARWRAAEGGDKAQADGMLAAEAVRLLNENRDKPFFIGVGFHKPHDPFVAPKEYFNLYPLDEVKLAEDPNDRTPILKHALPDGYNFETFADKDRREFKRAYHACTSFVDAQVGKLLDAMEHLKLWENTIVVLLGDHGYHLGEHGWWNKVTVFDIGARVPLVMWVPKSGGMGTETEAVVELLDLYPTLVDLCDLKPPHELRGESLRPVVEDPSISWQRPAFTQVVRGPVGMGYSVRYGDWRLTQWGQNGSGGQELYNVVKDNEGYYNYAKDPEHAAILDQLYGHLKKGYPQINRGPKP